MRIALACSLFLCMPQATPAVALVGGAGEAPANLARHLVMIVSADGSSCTGAAVSRDLVLTAAHCVGVATKLVEFDAARNPALKDIAAVTRHPQFDLTHYRAGRVTADVALLKLREALPVGIVPAELDGSDRRAVPGERLTVAGMGVSRPGDGRSGGTARAAELVVTGKPGTLQIRLMDPATRNERAGLGACTGDSGAPVFRSAVVVGVVSWTTGARNEQGCGGLTGVTPLVRYRGWISEQMRKLGAGI
jgi:secreted trypsin-like serine protease